MSLATAASPFRKKSHRLLPCYQLQWLQHNAVAGKGPRAGAGSAAERDGRVLAVPGTPRALLPETSRVSDCTSLPLPCIPLAAPSAAAAAQSNLSCENAVSTSGCCCLNRPRFCQLAMVDSVS